MIGFSVDKIFDFMEDKIRNSKKGREVQIIFRVCFEKIARDMFLQLWRNKRVKELLTPPLTGIPFSWIDRLLVTIRFCMKNHCEELDAPWNNTYVPLLMTNVLCYDRMGYC